MTCIAGRNISVREGPSAFVFSTPGDVPIASSPPFFSFRQLSSGLLRHHVLGIPIGPVRIAPPSALFVQSVGGLRASKRVRQIVRRREGRRRGVDATGEPRGPGAADVIFVPNWTEHPEPGGVN
jgi:hypothetical protein